MGGRFAHQFPTEVPSLLVEDQRPELPTLVRREDCGAIGLQLADQPVTSRLDDDQVVLGAADDAVVE